MEIDLETTVFLQAVTNALGDKLEQASATRYLANCAITKTTWTDLVSLVQQGRQKIFNLLFTEQGYDGQTPRDVFRDLIWCKLCLRVGQSNGTPFGSLLVRSAFAPVQDGEPAPKRARASVSRFIIVAPMSPNEYYFFGEAAILIQMARSHFNEIVCFRPSGDQIFQRKNGFSLYAAQVACAKTVLAGKAAAKELEKYHKCLEVFLDSDWRVGAPGLEFRPMNDCTTYLNNLADTMSDGDRIGIGLINHGIDEYFVCNHTDKSQNIHSDMLAGWVTKLVKKNATVLTLLSFCQANKFHQDIVTSLASSCPEKCDNFCGITTGSNTDWNVVVSDIPDLVVGGATLSCVLGLQSDRLWDEFTTLLCNESYGEYLPASFKPNSIGLGACIRVDGAIQLWKPLFNNSDLLPNYFTAGFTCDVQRAQFSLAPHRFSVS